MISGPDFKKRCRSLLGSDPKLPERVAKYFGMSRSSAYRMFDGEQDVNHSIELILVLSEELFRRKS